MRRYESRGSNVVRRELAQQVLERSSIAREHETVGRIERRYDDPSADVREIWANLTDTRADRTHRSERRVLLHDSAATDEQPQSIRQWEDACNARSGELSEAMACDQTRVDAP